MDQMDGNTGRKEYQQVIEAERYQLEGFRKAGMSVRAIALIMGRDRRTIQREIARGTRIQRNSDLTERREYLADAGESDRRNKAAMKGRGLKIGKCHALAEFLEEKIVEEKYSPYAAIEAAKAQEEPFDVMICTKTLYNYIDSEVFAGISNKDLPVKRKKAGKKPRRIRRLSLKNLKGRSIDERPDEVEDRRYEGSWEMDTVVGAQGTSAALLVLTERKTRQELIKKMPDKTQASVINALDELERENEETFKEGVIDITADNGVEFLGTDGLERSAIDPNKKRAQVYYAHPYSAFERGSNENANKLIRRFIPKGVDIGDYSDEDITRIQHWMNHYPRKLFGGRTANDVASFKVAV